MKITYRFTKFVVSSHLIYIYLCFDLVCLEPMDVLKAELEKKRKLRETSAAVAKVQFCAAFR